MACRLLCTLFLIHFLIFASTEGHQHGNHHRHHGRSSATLHDVTGSDSSTSIIGLEPRALDKGRCDASNECADKSCCNGNSGWCGLDPDHCAAGVCLSNCGAKADCGRGADVPGATCPLNVCCGASGYCGTTTNFCSADLGCQSNCPQPGPIQQSGDDVRNLVIGYWEGWVLSDRSCRKRTVDDVPVDSLTHLNLAFAYIEPKTFEIVPMPNMGESAFSQISNLKQKAPGLKIWISIGGWTFSDNDTDTQAVWGDLASTQAKRTTFATNLRKFCMEWGFDGVDLDWEYPGAPDRGGHKDDGKNYVSLIQSISVIFQASGQGSGLGLSFTAPTSYWYLRWFKIAEMHKYVNWINLMTYDLHGSWDSPLDQIGSFVYAHTNQTEIEDSLNLFWRAGVPANKVNLGLGFYGRSYKLEDANCVKPGCPFERAGTAGQCTGESGILSYYEIEELIKKYDLDVYHDEVANVKYLAWGDNQWVSYDDKETFGKKVDYASKQGLLGLFIWAIDLDDKDHTALQAVLGGKLGKFAQQNGYDPARNNGTGWDSITGNQCSWTKCGEENCGIGTVSIGATQYCGMKDKEPQKQTLCCPLAAAPSSCHWAADQSLFFCTSACNSSEISVASSIDPYVGGSHQHCFSGFAQYCCKAKETEEDLCSWTDKCADVKDESVCGDRKFVTTKQGDCKYPNGYAFCCDKKIDTSSCIWNEGSTKFGSTACEGASSCPSGLSLYGSDEHGGKDKNGKSHECQFELWTDDWAGTWEYATLAFCCDPKAFGRETVNLPVPLSNLFPQVGPDSDVEKLDITVDRTMGGVQNAGNDLDPDHNTFGFYILSGPEDEITTFDKRDGSHWELFDCDNTVGEARQTVKAVCTDTSENSNCNVIFKDGVAATVVEMPQNCGPGKYSVAVALSESVNHSHLHHRLEKRGLQGAPVYDFTFDYDYSPIHARAKSQVLMRIDYSDDPGYWSHIVEAPPGKHDKAKRDLEIETIFDGDHKAWLEHTWRKEKRHFTDLDELHKRWWSGSWIEWWDEHKKVDEKYEGIRHNIKDKFKVNIFDQDLKCPSFPEWVDELYFRSWAELTVDIKTAAGVTIIGNLGDLQSFNESSAWFHTSGSIDASLNFEAKGKVSFHTGNVELFGAHNFGASFRVPGIVTIGPDFRILASLAGDASLHMTSSYSVNFAKWDYSMRYPVPEGKEEKPAKEDTLTEPEVAKSKEFKWDMDAKGSLTAHIIPKVTFGIVFDSSAISNAALDLGVDAYTRLYADAKVGSNQPLEYCYGVDAGAVLFGNVEAPKLFQVDYSRYYPISSFEKAIFERECHSPQTP